MISPDRLERYSDFVDPERTGAPYDPRQGLERLMGVLSPDTKGIVLAVMGYDWYGTESQLQKRVFGWLEVRGLPRGVWPITISPTWEYCKHIDNNGEIGDGSLVSLGAVVKKAEDPSQILYSRSIAGADLAVPLVQQAVGFVSKAREYAEKQRLQGKKPHKFDSMWRIVGSVGSSTEQRRPLAVLDTIDCLTHNPGKHNQLDVHIQTQISIPRLSNILSSLGNCGIIDYTSAQEEVEGHRGTGWSVYKLVDPQSVMVLDPDKLYQGIRNRGRNFFPQSYLARVMKYIKEYPNSEYEHGALAKKLGINPINIGNCLSILADLGVLGRPDPGFKGRVTQAVASANDLTRLFYDLVCSPAKEVADTLSPLPLGPWNRREVAIYLENYKEERSQRGSQGGEEARRILLDILPQDGEEMKKSYIADLYNSRAERELRASSLGRPLQSLINSGDVEKLRPGYYRRVQKVN